MGKVFAIAALIGMVLANVGAAHAEGQSCKPGAQFPCTCPDGKASIMACGSDGQTLFPCACATSVPTAATVTIPILNAAVGTVPVFFKSYRFRYRYRYQLNIAGKTFTTPVTLNIAPGPIHVGVVTPAGTTFERDLTIPSQSGFAVIWHERTSQRRTAKILMGIGGGVFGAGMGLGFGAYAARFNAAPELNDTLFPLAVTGWSFSIVGAVLLVTGGALYATADQDRLEFQGRPVRQPLVPVVIGLAPSPQGGVHAGATFEF